MPELLTKHPELTLKVLKGAGAVCGEGAEQKILKQCPAERFCSLQSGEICVYGVGDIAKMTQLTVPELAAAVCTDARSALPGGAGTLFAAVFVVGLVLGRWWPRRKARPPDA
ncbi:hypothetical protein [Crenobacter cavernae]|uniref:Uncharacterized protein n=1 Tax=Crenobacter cavernae TaxID=2290923 RepID=A0ABY0FJX8_9NEIS|nr:hypothetical protein [Crenobacter cavernae]RXZ45694.1 hypothetical protein EBB06_02135 [Crenobacter cavernae]